VVNFGASQLNSSVGQTVASDTERMTGTARFSTGRLALVAILLTVAGVVTSSVTSLALWVALVASGGRLNAAVVIGASLGVAIWLALLIGAARLLGKVLQVGTSSRQEAILAACAVGGVVVGALSRKWFQLLHPEVLPPPEAYALIVVPTAVLVFAMWKAFGRRLLERVAANGGQSPE
jgi:hypothetical protein